jgi:glycosyltransferase involved in cell wall biosynthesis
MPEQVRKKALLIAYYWPPAGGPGVMRWLRFSKYFNENGWDLTVLVPQNPAYPIVDESLINHVSPSVKVLKVPIFEPAAMFGQALGNQKGVAFVSDKKPGLLQKLAIWFRGNYLIPDARRFWIRPATKFLLPYLQENPHDALISTGPPHSLHLIARNVKRQTGIKWLADFRDPWTGIDFYKELMLSKSADRRHRELEKSVLTEADVVCTVSPQWAADLQRLSGRSVEVVGNGYEFKNTSESLSLQPEKFSIAHFGSMPAARNPRGLWQALQELLTEIPELKKDLQILFAGNVDYSIPLDIQAHGLSEFIVNKGQVAHHQSIELQNQSAILLLVANDTPNASGILTGKFYEYMNARRPILAFGPEGGNLQQEIQATSTGDFVPYGNVDVIKDVLRRYYRKYKEGTLFVQPKNLQEYDSRHLAAKICALIR